MGTLGRRTVLKGLAVGGVAFAGPATAGPTIGRTGDATPVPSDDRFAAEVDQGLAYFRRRAAQQVPLVESLRDAIAAGDIESARRAYIATRPPYEEIEVLAASFPETDEAIDARPYAIAGGETSPDYVSVHRIESLIFRDNDLPAALPYAERLIESVRTLQADLDRRKAFDSVRSFEGMLALSEEVASKKISSEEETWSDQSLLIFFHNWRGIESQYTPFAAAVERSDEAAAVAAREAFATAMATLERYPARDGVFPPYSSVPLAARGDIVRASYRLRDALARAAGVLRLI